jgi:hypothetical protein
MVNKIIKEIEGFTIESGVPLTDASKSKDKWARLVAGMSIGDSVVLKKSGDVVSFRMMCKKQGFSCKSRSIRDNEGQSTSDVRVWKLENED